MKHSLLNYISGKRNGFLAVHIILTKTTSQTIYNGFRFISAKYENMTLIRNFNVSPEDSHKETFCESYGSKNLIKVPTCHKNPPNLSCIDLILKNSPLSFQSSGVIETGLSDFHKMIVTVMKITFQKLDPKIIYY